MRQGGKDSYQDLSEAGNTPEPEGNDSPSFLFPATIPAESGRAAEKRLKDRAKALREKIAEEMWKSYGRYLRDRGDFPDEGLNELYF